MFQHHCLTLHPVHSLIFARLFSFFLIHFSKPTRNLHRTALTEIYSVQTKFQIPARLLPPEKAGEILKYAAQCYYIHYTFLPAIFLANSICIDAPKVL